MALNLDDVRNYKFDASAGAKAVDAAYSKKKKDESDTMGDLWSSFGSGAGNLASGVGTFFAGSDSDLAQWGYDAQDYWNARKSAQLVAEEEALSAKIAAGDYLGAGWDVLSNLHLATNMLAGSAPSMATGMGVGGLLAKASVKAGLMLDAAGGLSRTGGAITGGLGEASVIAPDIYQNTKGNLAAAGVGGVLLGVVPSVVLPGNIASAAARKMGGSEVAGKIGGLGTGNAFGRATRTAGAEFGQELGQEGGQALVEQAGRGEELNFKSALAQGVVGGILGGQTGLALHPITGEGAPIKPAPTPAEEIAAADARAAENPNNPALKDEADTLKAEVVANNATPEEIAHGNAIAQSEAQAAILDPSGTIDQAIEAFARAADASSIGRVAVAGVQRTNEAAEQVAQEAAPTLTDDNLADAEAEAAAIEEQEKAAKQARAAAEKQRLNDLRVAQQEIKLQHTADKVNAERQKLGLPSINPELLNSSGNPEQVAPAATLDEMTLEIARLRAATPVISERSPEVEARIAELDTAARALAAHSSAFYDSQERAEKQVRNSGLPSIEAGMLDQTDASSGNREQQGPYRVEPNDQGTFDIRGPSGTIAATFFNEINARKGADMRSRNYGTPEARARATEKIGNLQAQHGALMQQHPNRALRPPHVTQELKVLENEMETVAQAATGSQIEAGRLMMDARERASQQAPQASQQSPQAEEVGPAPTRLSEARNARTTAQTAYRRQLRTMGITGRKARETFANIEKLSDEDLLDWTETAEIAGEDEQAEYLRAVAEERAAERAAERAKEEMSQEEMSQEEMDDLQDELAEDAWPDDQSGEELWNEAPDIWAGLREEAAREVGPDPVAAAREALDLSLRRAGRMRNPIDRDRAMALFEDSVDRQRRVAEDTGGNFSDEAIAYARALLDSRTNDAVAQANLALDEAREALVADIKREGGTDQEIEIELEFAAENAGAYADGSKDSDPLVQAYAQALVNLARASAERQVARPVAPPNQPVGGVVEKTLQRGQPGIEGIRGVKENFITRLAEARNNGVLPKLAEFWKTLMSSAKQRTLPPIDFKDIEGAIKAAQLNREKLPQSALTVVKDRYNAALKKNAKRWARANNEPWVEANWIDPIHTLEPELTSGYNGQRVNSGFKAWLHGLRTEGNPYMVKNPRGYPAPFEADSGIHADRLDQSPGSAPLAYRLATEIGLLRGVGYPSDNILSTVNNLRRALQSVSADTWAGVGIIDPIDDYSESRAGMPAPLWNRLNDQEKIGANVLRATHSLSVNRGEPGRMRKTTGTFLENLMLDKRGNIYAASEPKLHLTANGDATTNGWPKGTQVTPQMLKNKVGAVDPVTGYHVYAMQSGAAGGVGVGSAMFGIMNNTILNHIENNPGTEIPAWMMATAKRIGRERDGWFFSEADRGTNGPGVTLTREEAIEHAGEMLGKDVVKLLMDSGKLRFVQSGAELTGNPISSKNGKVQGATDRDGNIVLVLDNLSSDTMLAVLQHEGLHATLKGLVGEATYDRLISQLGALLQAGAGSNWAKESAKRVPGDTKDKNYLEEVAAYAVELYALGASDSNPLVKWAKRFMSAIRSAIIKNTSLPESVRTWAIKNVQAQDLSRLAVAGLKARATSAGPMRFSERGRNFAAEVESILAELADPATTKEERVELNDRLRVARTFAEASKDVSFEEEMRFSMAPVTPAAPNELNLMNEEGQKAFERANSLVRRAIQDKNLTLRRIQQIAGITADQIKMDTIGALDRLGSKLQSKQDNLVRKPLAKIESILNKAGFSADDGREAIDDLLIARHVAEYNAHTEQINPAKYNSAGDYLGGHDATHPGAGITNADAAATIARLTSHPKAAAILEAEKVYRDMITDLQQNAVDMGLEKQEVIDAWNIKFKNYTPFNRELDLDENLSVGSSPGMSGFSMRAGISRRAMGSKADIISPLASTMAFGLKSTTRGENAEVTRTLYEFAKTFVPNHVFAGQKTPMWEVEKVPSRRVIKRLRVYEVTKADGTQSSEFYNRNQANAFAAAQKLVWDAANPNAPAGSNPVKITSPFGNNLQSRVITLPVPDKMNEPNVIVVPIQGEDHIITFDKNSKDAMRVVNALKNPGMKVSKNPIIKLARMFSRWVMATSTGFNPVFIAFNAMRDVQAAMVSVNADKIPGWDAADTKSVLFKWPAAFNDIRKQLAREFRQLHDNTYTAPPPAAGSMAEAVEEMRAYGGATGIIQSMSDMESIETDVRRLFGQDAIKKSLLANEAEDALSKANDALAKVGDAFHRFGSGETKLKGMALISKHVPARIARLNEAAELTTRAIVFKQATKRFEGAGYDPETARKMAANISKNVSTNFNRRGEWSTITNTLFPFFNAAMQGSARLAETIFEKATYKRDLKGHVVLDQKTKLTPFGKKVLGLAASLGGIQAMLLMMAGFEDDDIPETIKDRAFIVPIGGKNYIALPMPHGFNAIINAGREITQGLMSGDLKKAGEHFVRGTLLQIPAFNPMGSAGNPLMDFAPAIADPVVGIVMNKDAFGRPIAREDIDQTKPTPGFTRGREGAGAVATKAAELLNWMSGGTEFSKGAISPAPEQLEFIAGFIGGGVGREVSKTWGLAKNLAGINKEDIPIHKLPLINRLYGSADTATANRSKMFEVRRDLNEKYGEHKGLLEAGRQEEAAAFKEENPELALRQSFERFARQDAKRRKARRAAREADEFDKVNEITDEQNEKIKAKLEAYRRAKAK